jgi:hypothetical protein
MAVLSRGRLRALTSRMSNLNSNKITDKTTSNLIDELVEREVKAIRVRTTSKAGLQAVYGRHCVVDPHFT